MSARRALVDLSHVLTRSGTTGLAQLMAAPGFRAVVLATEATVVLGQLKGVRAVSLGERVAPFQDVVIEALSSGFSLGSCNWRLRLWGRTLGVLCESSLWSNRHCLPFDDGLLSGAQLLIVCIARGSVGDSTRVAAELKALLALPTPVVVPLVRPLSGPLIFDVLDEVQASSCSWLFSNLGSGCSVDFRSSRSYRGQ